MNTGNGNLVNQEILNTFTEDEKKNYVEVKRDLSESEKFHMQIKMYSPCACGSGKKFKFCCYKKP